MSTGRRIPLVVLRGEIKTPPFSRGARIETGTLLRRLQEGESIGMPQSRPMPSIGRRCHELRINDGERSWRIVYRVDIDAIVLVDVFPKTSRKTPQKNIDEYKRRLRRFDEAVRNARRGSHE